MIGFYEWLFGTREQNLTEMTKVELEALGRKHNIELDRRLKKATLIKQLKKVMGKANASSTCRHACYGRRITFKSI